MTATKPTTHANISCPLCVSVIHWILQDLFKPFLWVFVILVLFLQRVGSPSSNLRAPGNQPADKDEVFSVE